MRLSGREGGNGVESQGLTRMAVQVGGLSSVLDLRVFGSGHCTRTLKIQRDATKVNAGSLQCEQERTKHTLAQGETTSMEPLTYKPRASRLPRLLSI